ncbi:SDR family NAD(P)-dependent oxidoreductase [Alteromonadaceae bacterium M269]|nr:SDR family NAD(P)-dependent oxidoreductase [Alteromonadaceae bacterium M269]
MNPNQALVIGANGGIGQEVVKQLCASQSYERVYSVARTQSTVVLNSQCHTALNTADESAVEAFVDELKSQSLTFSTVICCSGILHRSSEPSLNPEKRLEDINTTQLSEYFMINSILPAIWLRNLPQVIDKSGATITLLSARVGSISDNELGGWYGYRASKAALNMLVKTAAVEYKRRLPNTTLICYHPGTVDTALSKPFQANVKPEKLFTTEFTVNRLLNLISSVDKETSPHYLDWDGKPISW